MKKQSFFSAMPLPLLSVLAVLVITGACQHPGGHGDALNNLYGRISVQSVPMTNPTAVFDNYVYTFTKSATDTPSLLTPDSNGYFTLEVGTYTVSVEAYIGTSLPSLVASGISEPFTIATGDNDPVVVYLAEAETEAKGEFAYIITYPENAWGEIKLKKYPEMTAVGLAPSHVCDSNGLTETVELNAGVYLLTVEVSMNGRYAGVTETVHIYPSLTTIYDKDFIDDDFTTIPPEIVQPSESEQPPEPPTVAVTRNITIDMFDSYGDGWGGTSAIRININGIDIAIVKVNYLNTINTPTGQRSANTYTFQVTSGDIVELFWIVGSSQGENSFIVYYADSPPLPAFNRENNANWIGENALVVKLLGSLYGIKDGSLLGSFMVD